MKWPLTVVGVALTIVTFSMSGAAETIRLRSGEEITGKILDQDINSRTIAIEVNGAIRTISIDDIADIKEMRETAGPSTEPMYGGTPRTTPEQQAMDQQLIEESVRMAGSREAAVEEFIKLGWEYHDRGDLNTAMKRFNQAWLLDPSNPDIFWGFGSVSLARRNSDQAIEMFKKATELNPRHAIATCSLGSAYQLKAYDVARQSPTRATTYLEQSATFCEQGSRLDPREEFCFSTWAGTLLLEGQYAEAWEKVKMARKLGGKTISPDFLKTLSAAMPEPSE